MAMGACPLVSGGPEAGFHNHLLKEAASFHWGFQFAPSTHPLALSSSRTWDSYPRGICNPVAFLLAATICCCWPLVPCQEPEAQRVLSLPKQQTAGSRHMLSNRLLPYQQRCQRLHQMYSRLEGHSPTSGLHLSRVTSDWQLVSLSLLIFPVELYCFSARCLWKFFGSAFLPKWQKHLYGTVSSSLKHDCPCRVSLILRCQLRHPGSGTV